MRDIRDPEQAGVGTEVSGGRVEEKEAEGVYSRANSSLIILDHLQVLRSSLSHKERTAQIDLLLPSPFLLQCRSPVSTSLPGKSDLQLASIQCNEAMMLSTTLTLDF